MPVVDSATADFRSLPYVQASALVAQAWAGYVNTGDVIAAINLLVKAVDVAGLRPAK